VLAFYGATTDKLIISKNLVFSSFACWLTGLFLAIAAGHSAYYAQQKIISLLRNRRHQRGMESLGTEYPHLLGTPGQRPIEEIMKLIKKQDKKGKIGFWLARLFSVGSLLAAVCGAIFALAALWFSSRVGGA
jgi:hypothetical protein